MREDSGIPTASSLPKVHYEVSTAICHIGLQENTKQVKDLYNMYSSEADSTDERLQGELCDDREEAIRDPLQIVEDDLEGEKEIIEKTLNEI